MQLQTFILYILPKYNFDIYYKPQIIHFYPQYLFLTNENGEECDVHNEIEINKLENSKDYKLINFDNFNLKTYKYSNYFSNESLKVLNTIYNKDFVYFNYDKIQKLPGT